LQSRKLPSLSIHGHAFELLQRKLQPGFFRPGAGIEDGINRLPGFLFRGNGGFDPGADEILEPLVIGLAEGMGVFIDLADRGAGDDVVKLQQQRVFPDVSELTRIIIAG